MTQQPDEPRGPRIPDLAKELPTRSKERLAALGIDIATVQAWLDAPGNFDGATGVMDICEAAEGIHDWGYSTPNVGKEKLGRALTRHEVDDLYYNIMMDVFRRREMDAGGLAEAEAFAFNRWLGVRVFGNPWVGWLFGVTAPAWNPMGTRKWVP